MDMSINSLACRGGYYPPEITRLFCRVRCLHRPVDFNDILRADVGIRP